MTTNKATMRRPVEAHEPAADDLRIAYEIHTLVQLISARLAAVAGPWSPVLH